MGDNKDKNIINENIGKEFDKINQKLVKLENFKNCKSKWVPSC